MGYGERDNGMEGGRDDDDRWWNMRFVIVIVGVVCRDAPNYF